MNTPLNLGYTWEPFGWTRSESINTVQSIPTKGHVKLHRYLHSPESRVVADGGSAGIHWIWMYIQEEKGLPTLPSTIRALHFYACRFNISVCKEGPFPVILCRVCWAGSLRGI